MRYLSLAEVAELHRLLIEAFGGSHGIRDLGALESALAQPRMSFGGEDLYPTVVEKVAALGFTLVQNHPFLDGNKRVGHAAMETFLVLNGFELDRPPLRVAGHLTAAGPSTPKALGARHAGT